MSAAHVGHSPLVIVAALRYAGPGWSRTPYRPVSSQHQSHNSQERRMV